ncbi:MAG: Na+/H+ antiporter subunit E [Caldibacillus debilis]|jgi:multicomponent Na+:H+ antiporter subunit E|uniref:Multisubunit sodium/proton antiporter, MrpE subunit n=3 Tax=Caldibacillus debilis TaxID=301148 RepID=A0A420VHH1_9BACI|nr:Na+/H+ antiporter subunit E [Caldibacillus debilis]MBO2481656.1 Na+/H+ antiporter subunit E [Bacillaceae bacterium]MBY6273288.1 Na+/H+ antiporter subunit E [Bacillaceae bacterium]OUM87086.1 MAG: cation:proton antiporter [Caldibacillus debilis]REJ17276.1 MAG: Na+/H+ antiporter subunit E [Caldibacillus debilis]REJ28305.1 MAG: Na+/H+ antiporter subunit E [Caldibacillus debilis]
MPGQVLINLLIAALWMFLHDSWSFLSFFGGYLVGIFILFFIRRFFKKPFYIIMIARTVKLLAIFIVELISSSFLVMRQVLRPNINVKPGIFRLETDLDSDIEVTLLAMLITLTPGSVVMEITPDSRALYIHAMDIPESRDAVLRSQKVFEKAIKDVTRL